MNMRNPVFMLGVFLCLALSLIGPQQGRCDEPEDVTYVIPIEGAIEKALLYVIRRGVQQAEAERAGAIVFVVDTPGGQLGATDEIVRLLLRLKIPTYAFVKSHAFSAGAIIAFATDRIYMAPGSVIGAATPVMMSPLGGPQEMPDVIEEKTLSGVSALIRSAAQSKGHDPQLAEAMVRMEKEFRVGETLISPAGELLTLTNTEAEQMVGEDEEDMRPLLSSGTAGDLDELLEMIGRGGSRVVTLEVTGAERIARIIASLSVFLLAGGLLGLYIEFRTPGFGVPGIVGVICLVIFFWGHHIAGLAGMEDMLIFLLGAALLLVEIFLIPGFGVIGIAGFALMILGLFSAMLPQMRDISPTAFHLRDMQTAFNVIAGALVLTGIAALAVSPFVSKSRMFKWIALDKSMSKDTGFISTDPTEGKIGLKGTTLTPLRPGGTGEFDGERLNIVTRGEFLEAGTPVRIAEAHGRRIIVEQEGNKESTG